VGGADFADPALVKMVTLDDACRQQQVGEGHFPSLAAVPTTAFTVTIPAILAAKTLLCIVPEARKAAIVRRALRDPVSEACPATAVRTKANATIFLDGGSSAGLFVPGL
jgi:glucosamine-6-phosphate deaminase